MATLIALVGSVFVTAGWYLLIQFIFNSPRLIEIFMQRGLIMYIIAFVGFFSVILVLIYFITYILEYKKNTIGKAIANIKNVEEFNVLKESCILKIQEDHNYLYFFSTLCVSLGFLGTVIGLSGGMSSLSAVFGSSSDYTDIRGTILNLIASLGVAFDSTLLGLIFSIIASLFTSFSKKYCLKSTGNLFNVNKIKLLEDYNKLSVESLGTGKLETLDNQKLNEYIQNLQELNTKLNVTLETNKEVYGGLTSLSDFKGFYENSIFIKDAIYRISKILEERLMKEKKYMLYEYNEGNQ